VVESLDHRQRVYVDVDDRQVLVPVRGELVRVALPAAPLVMAAEVADNRRLAIPWVAVECCPVAGAGTAELV
jgi:hypothetical protein